MERMGGIDEAAPGAIQLIADIYIS